MREEEIKFDKINVKILYDENDVKIIDSYKINRIDDMIIVLRLFQMRTDFKTKRNLKR